MIKTTDLHELRPVKRPRGRPRKQRTQTAEERRAYMREYQSRPERLAYQRAYHKRRREEETAEERESRLGSVSYTHLTLATLCSV